MGPRRVLLGLAGVTAAISLAAGSMAAAATRAAPAARAGGPGLARYLSDQAREASAAPRGYTPAEIRHHYFFDKIADDKKGNPANGTGQTIGIVIWGSDPHIQANLQNFINQYRLKQLHGLTGKKCSRPAGYAQVPCFEILNTGKTPAPTDYGTFSEESDDVEWAHVAAPGANIIVAQAPVTCTDHDPARCKGPTDSALDTAIEKVVHAGATVVSMSFADPDISQKQALAWDQLDAAFVSGQGDAGYPAAGYPAADPAVLSVGGTVITKVAGTGADNAWKWTGGGLTKEPRPGYQINWTQSTDVREVNDVAYDALNYPVRNVSPDYPGHPWQVRSGVSLGIPQWAGLIADADQVRAADGKSILAGQGVMDGLYRAAVDPTAGTINPAYLTDVTAGCAWPRGGPHKCVKQAAKGYDVLTGLGTPDAADLVYYLGYDI
jgi:subtilase family serine protease